MSDDACRAKITNRSAATGESKGAGTALRRIIRDCNYEVMDKREGNEEVTLLPRFSSHSLRHTFTTRMCEAGVKLKPMQGILGHADAETTMDIYAEATPDLKRAELINFADCFNKQKAGTVSAV